MRIAVLANLKQNAPLAEGSSPDAWAELDSTVTVQSLVTVLERAGHVAKFFEGDLTLVDALPRFAPDLCFNLCEGHFGESRESHIPALLELLRIPYTGSGVLALSVTLDKAMTKRVLAFHDLPTPPFQVFECAEAPLDPRLRFPLFVKPVHEGSGMGVAKQSIVHDECELRARVAWLIATYRQPALVEHFIAGRELTIGVFGNRDTAVSVPDCGPWAELHKVGGLAVLPPYEVVLDSREGSVYTYKKKSGDQDGWLPGRNYHCPAALSPALQQELERLAAAAFLRTGCRDLARIDFRLEEHTQRPYILEVNALPGLCPGWSDLCFEALAAGISYEELVLGILAQATRRVGLDDPAQVVPVHARTAAVGGL